MDVTETRHRNLHHLVDHVLRPRGITKNKDAAQAMGGLGESYLSQLKAGKKMGDDTARRIEAALGLRHGSMDAPMWHVIRDNAELPAYLEPAPLTPREQALLANYRAADETTKNVVDAAAAAGAQPAKVRKTS